MRTYSHIKILLIALIFVVGLSALPHAINAQVNGCVADETKGQYCLLEPLPIGVTGVDYGKYDPATTNAAGYINLVIKIFIGIIGVLGAVMIVLGGIQYMTTDAVSKKEGGKEMITNSIFGLILALASWVVLNTINPHLLDINLDGLKNGAVAVTVSAEDDAPTKNVPVKTYTGATVQSKCTQVSADAANIDGISLVDGSPWGNDPVLAQNEATYRSKLLQAGVNINAGNCSVVGQKGCTSVYRLGDSVVTHLGTIRNYSCGSNSACKLTLTGGTECWLHQTHQIGSGNVDLAATDPLNIYITGSKDFPNDGKLHSQGGFSFLAEKSGQTSNTTGAHWHVNLK
jgi:hypothetical protein